MSIELYQQLLRFSPHIFYFKDKNTGILTNEHVNYFLNLPIYVFYDFGQHSNVLHRELNYHRDHMLVDRIMVSQDKLDDSSI